MRASRFSFGVADGVVLPPSPVAVARAPAAGSPCLALSVGDDAGTLPAAAVGCPGPAPWADGWLLPPSPAARTSAEALSLATPPQVQSAAYGWASRLSPAVAEPSFARGGQQLLRDMAALLRVPFAGACLGDGKSHAPASVNVFLGVEQDFRRFPQLRESEAGASAERLQGIVEELDRVLAGGSFAGTPGPSKLCGRLHFTISWGAGRFGNAALQPLHDACKEGRPAEIGDDLRVALKFIRAMLVDPVTGKPVQRRRRFRYAGSRSTLPTVLVWSDARWEAAQDRPAGIGFVVFFPASKAAADVAASSRTPPWLLGARTPPGRWRFAAYEPAASEYAHWRARSQYIGQLELLAAVSVYYSLAEDLRGRRVLHFIDNSGAMAGLVRDYSRDRDSAGLVHTFWALAVGLEIDVWFIFVYSEANIADWPSRGHVVFADDLGAEEVSLSASPPKRCGGTWRRRWRTPASARRRASGGAGLGGATPGPGRAGCDYPFLSFFESLAMARPPSAAAPPAGWLVLAALRAASREPKQRLNA